MKTKAVRMYGTRDLRLEEFELPEIKDDEILAKIITDSICMSTYKLVEQGKKHKRAPQNMDTHPIITGHEFAGVIVKVGKKWQDQFKPGMRFAQQPALNYKAAWLLRVILTNSSAATARTASSRMKSWNWAPSCPMTVKVSSKPPWVNL